MMLALMKEMVIIHVHQKYIIVSLMIFAYWKEIGILDMEVIPMMKYPESKQMQEMH